jgi:uncharacterized membrane protein
MGRVARRAGLALLVLACIGYPYLVHSSVGKLEAGPLALILTWLPLGALALWALLRSRRNGAWLAVLLAAGLLVYVGERERMGLIVSSGLSHVAANLFLLWYFGRTLMRGREPLITRFARRVHGALQPGMESFARRLTIAWCVFFAAQLIASALLLWFAPLEAWSLFVNVLNFPLVALMFVGQWVYRGIRHPDCPRASIWRAVEAFIKDSSLSGRAELR